MGVVVFGVKGGMTVDSSSPCKLICVGMCSSSYLCVPSLYWGRFVVHFLCCVCVCVCVCACACACVCCVICYYTLGTVGQPFRSSCQPWSSYQRLFCLSSGF